MFSDKQGRQDRRGRIVVERSSRGAILRIKTGRTKLLSVAFCAVIIILSTALTGACTARSETKAADAGVSGTGVSEQNNLTGQVVAAEQDGTPDGSAGYSAAKIAEVIAAEQDGQTRLYMLTQGDSDFAYRVENGYLFEPSLITDGVICYADGFYADEICVLKTGSPADAKVVSDALSEYKTGRADTYAGYAPDQSAIADNGIVVTSGNCVALLICSDDAEKARNAFHSCFAEPLPELPTLSPFLTETEGTEEIAVTPTVTSVTTEATVATTTTTTTTATTTTTTAEPSVTAATSTTVTSATSATTVFAASVTTPTSAASVSAATTVSASVTVSAPPTTTAPTTAVVTALPTTTASAQNAATATTAATTPSTITATIPSATTTAATTATTTAVSEPIPDIYDHDAVLNAWRTGDVTGLGAKNLAILSACVDVIGKVITDGMSDYDKELAIHDYIIEWGDYDWAAESPNPNAVIEPDHDNPYGMLIGRKGICSGYSSTFQLFMDMLGIECITVNGTANRAQDEHAWNQVRMDDGEWYCVDVTWDDPFGQLFSSDATYHRFFNVTSRHMRDTFHFWDESAIPECTATQYGYGN